MSGETRTVDLTNCDREPIHKLGKIQDFGALIAVNNDWFVAHRSANLRMIVGDENMVEIGRPLEEIFSAPSLERLQSAVSAIVWPDQVERIFGLDLFGDNRLYDCGLHLSGPYSIIEIEPHVEGDVSRQLAFLRPTMSQLGKCETVASLVEEAARQLRHSLDMDRVMVYSFHDDLSGEVIAEAKRDDLEGFRGLRYPMTDIPAQARELYLRNRFRLISDVEADPVPLEPEVGLEGEPLDLSMSTLRSVSPIHIEYLRNMGVGASLSISIVINGKLWGLFACHHYSAKLLPYSQRTTTELFSELFSLMLESMIAREEAQLREDGREMHDRLMRDIAAGTSLAENLPDIDRITRNAIPHDGVSIFVEDIYNSRGAAPNEEEFRAIVPLLNSSATSRILATDSLVERIPSAERFADRAAGALVIPFSRTPRDYLVLWRRELKQTVTWAGNPEKPVDYGPNGARLTPRKSFEAWQESVEGRSEAWSDGEVKVAEGLRITLLEIILRVTDEAVQERARAQQQQELLIAELNHRVRNILNLIRGLIGQSKREAKDVETFVDIIGGRIGSLAMAHDNITKENWSSAPLSALIDSEVQAYLSGKSDRIVLEGPASKVSPEAYTVLALVIHEMITNSAKYGCLSDQSGTLSITTNRNDDGDLEIVWRESGGPPVKPPKRRGFGSTIIEYSIPHELGGSASIDYKLSGVEARFFVPARFVEWLGAESAEDTGQKKPAAKSEVGDLPASILLVEDSMIIALDTEDLLRDMGVPKVHVESTVMGALDSLKKHQPQLAILDYNLGSENSERVALELAKLKIPFWLATGYGEMGDKLEELGASGLLTKPYGGDELKELLREFKDSS